MKNDILWIGYYDDEMKASRALLKGLERKGYEIFQSSLPSSGIIALQQRFYPQIIVSDRIPAGEMKFPVGLNKYLYPVTFTRYVIQSIRDIPEYISAKIVVPHFLVEDDLKLLRVDSNVHFVDLFEKDSAG
jgi:hypothetical protein